MASDEPTRARPVSKVDASLAYAHASQTGDELNCNSDCEIDYITLESPEKCCPLVSKMWKALDT